MPIIAVTQPSSSDLVTQAYLASALADNALTAAQTALLPQLATSASRLIRKHCHRYFNRATWDELYTLEDNYSPLILRQFPVNAVNRLSINPTAVVTITNNSPSVQRATVQLATTGNVDTGLVVSGVALRSIASGVLTPTTILFSSLAAPTIQALANAINAVSGWVATPQSPYALWPVADLRAIQGVSPATYPAAAALQIHVDDVPFSVEESTGIVTLNSQDDEDPFDSFSFGPTLITSFGDLQVYGGPNAIRVVYDAGTDTVYEDVQQACVETVWDMLRLVQRDQRLSKEQDGEYEYEFDTKFPAYPLPTSVMGKLALYRNLRA